MATIHATGLSSAHYPAERATVTALVMVSDADRAVSMSRASTLHNSLVSKAKQLVKAGDAVQFEARAASTYSHRVDHGNEPEATAHVEHTTTSSVSVELSNLGLVSELVLELSEAGAQTDVRWSLTDESRRQHLREARQEAVHEARATADDYAAALGERVLNVTQITDQREMSIGAAPGRARLMMADPFVTAPEITIEQVEVSAAVVGEFVSGVWLDVASNKQCDEQTVPRV